jgi:S-adenosylmethionine:tRNA ribosyltransferase-isomerase
MSISAPANNFVSKQQLAVSANMHPKELQISSFSYPLPENRIARFPLEERDSSKLLIYKNGSVQEDRFNNIHRYLPTGSLIVFNQTRVIEARILFTKPSGGTLEVFLLDPAPVYQDITKALQQEGTADWKCLVGGASKWKHGYIPEKKIETGEGEIILRAEIIERNTGSFTIRFSWTPLQYSFASVIHYLGQVPLPPYLKRRPEITDENRYQTVYAKDKGSVAAPTAGLHFTERVFGQLKEKNIESVFLTLHVGAGTFMPVKADQMNGHEMHAEWIDVPLSAIEMLSQNLKPLFSVGTTSMRTLESLYWMGVKVSTDESITLGQLEISQWEVYDKLQPYMIPKSESLKALAQWLRKNNLQSLITKTQILIAPGYECKMIDGLITNFHQPESTLLLLVAAVIGSEWKSIYEFALNNNYRFLSYGDACLLYKNESVLT